MTKIVPLPSQPPQQGREHYHAFDRFITRLTELGELYEQAVRERYSLEHKLTSKQTCAAELIALAKRFRDWKLPDTLDAKLTAVAAGWKRYDADEFYSSDGNEDDDRYLTQRFVREQVGALLMAFPNAVPPNADGYLGMMTAEIIAANQSAMVVEMACRHLRRTHKFGSALTPADVLEAMTEQADVLDGLTDGTTRADWTQLESAMRAALDKLPAAITAAIEREEAEAWREWKQREQFRTAQRKRIEDDNAIGTRIMRNVTSNKFVWRWLLLLLWSRGIWLTASDLDRLWQEYHRDRNRALVDRVAKGFA